MMTFAGKQLFVDDDDYFTISVVPTHLRGGPPEVHVLLAGEFDLGARDRLCTALLEVVDTRPARVVVDLAEVAFVDSEAIGAIIEGYLAAHRAGIGFRLANATGNVRRVLELVNVPDLLEKTRAD
jgi:anti-anti-sigma factor